MSQTPWNPAAILLAGGASHRMGRDKALLPYGDVPLAAHVHARLSEVFETVLVVGRSGEFPVPGARCIGDRHPGGGPLEGLATGMEALEASDVLLAACDMPGLRVPLLRFLGEQKGDTEAVVPCSPRGPEPLLAVYSRRILPRLRAYLADGERSATRFLSTLQLKTIPFEVIRRYDPDGASFRNLNRPEDYQAALRDLNRPPG